MSERTQLEEIRERDARFPKSANDPRDVTDGFHRSGHDRRWLLERVDELEKALRHAEWNCAPGSEFCPSCHASETPMTHGNGTKEKGGHKRGCRIRKALAALHAPEPDRG